MKENMKYIYEEGKFINEYKIIKKINEGHDAGAVLLNQNNCKKFDLIDDTLTNIENIKKNNTCTDYFDITYIKIKTYVNNKIDNKILEGKIIVEREGYDFEASNENEDSIWFHVDILTELEVHFKDNNYKHLKCWGLIDNDEQSLVIYNPKEELEKRKKELYNQIKKIDNEINNIENFDKVIEKYNLIEDIEKMLESGLQDTYYEEDNINSKKSYPTKPDGNFIAMIEYFSGGVAPDDDPTYEGWFSKHDLSGAYIRDAMKDINKTQNLAKKIQEEFKDKVSVVFLDFNKGCQYGCAINVWIKK